MDKDLLESYVENGFSTYAIGKQVNKSYSTIRYWLNKYDLKTKHKSFKNGYHEDKISKSKFNLCSSCGIELTLDTGYKRTGKNRKGFYPNCKKCFTDKIKLKRKNSKERAIQYKGVLAIIVVIIGI